MSALFNLGSGHDVQDYGRTPFLGERDGVPRNPYFLLPWIYQRRARHNWFSL